MRTNTYRPDALRITPLNKLMRRIRRPIMQLLDRLPIHARSDRRFVLVVVVVEEGSEDVGRGGGGVVEARHAVPFADSILAADLEGFGIGSVGRGAGGGEEGDGGRYRLDAAVERGGVETLDWWVES